MNATLQIVCALLLFSLLYIAVRRAAVHAASVWLSKRRIKTSWPLDAAADKDAEIRSWRRYVRSAERHVDTMMEAAMWQGHSRSLFTLSFLLALAGAWTGIVAFGSVRGFATLSVMMGALPYLALRMRLLRLQMKARLEFLPAVEVFYQYYVLAEGRNPRNTIRKVLQENRIRYPMKPVFEQLYRHLSTNRGINESLHVFRLSVGHVWAAYFANMLHVTLVEGTNVSAGMQELIGDMRKAVKTAEQDRNRLLEIRIANFSPILFLVVFLAVNFRIDPEQSYHYYVFDPVGRGLLLDALMIIFVSFVVGIVLSIRRI